MTKWFDTLNQMKLQSNSNSRDIELTRKPISIILCNNTYQERLRTSNISTFCFLQGNAKMKTIATNK